MSYEQIASDSVIEKVVTALKERNVTTIVVNTKEQALEEIKKLIPRKGSVMNGSSTTLEQIGFVDYLKGGLHGWDNVHENILNETDSEKKAKLRRESVLADYFLGSVHAITEDGQLLIASASGSQIPSYAFTSNNVIWVAGAHKIVPNREDAFKRIEDYVYPLENKRMQSMGAPGSTIGRVLVFEREIMPSRHITLIIWRVQPPLYSLVIVPGHFQADFWDEKQRDLPGRCSCRFGCVFGSRERGLPGILRLLVRRRSPALCYVP